jgi:hypothetical protein
MNAPNTLHRRVFLMFTTVQKREAWELIALKFPGRECRELVWERSPDAVTWIKCADTLTLNTA